MEISSYNTHLRRNLVESLPLRAFLRGIFPVAIFVVVLYSSMIVVKNLPHHNH